MFAYEFVLYCVPLVIWLFFQEKKETRKEEEQKFGIYFDDDYDYLQHLKDVDEINDVGPGAEVYRIDAKEKKKEVKKIE